MSSRRLSQRHTAKSIVAGTVVFPIIVIFLSLVQRGHYSPVRQAISELALGRAGSLMVVAFCSLGTGIFLLGRLIRWNVARARVVPVLLSVAAVFAGPMSAAFHTDRTGATATWHGNIHNLAGISAFVLVLISMGVCSYRFRKDPIWRRFATATTAWTSLGVVTFVLIPLLGDPHFGLAQRLFVGTFVAWIIHAGLFALRAGEDQKVRRDKFESAAGVLATISPSPAKPDR